MLCLDSMLLHRSCNILNRSCSVPIKTFRLSHYCFSSIGPLEQYKQLCNDKILQHDEYQIDAVMRLNHLNMQLQNISSLSSSSSSFNNNNHQIKGLYMHAGVGRGKTVNGFVL